MLKQRGVPAPERHRGRLSLTTWQPRKIAQLGSGEHADISDFDDAAQRFAAWLWAERNSWSIRRAGLLAEGRRLHRVDADRALRQQLAALAVGGDA